MSEPVVVAEGLSKQYRIGAAQTQTSLLGGLRRAAGRLLRPNAAPPTFWALEDATFTIHRGEVVGLIGRNGAGKSTLLKILSRITLPTRGRAMILGRVGSLLEVGTGFHPEMTGRENIYMNGMLLGMRRGEVARKFDEIVEFSGVEQFIDTPVKRYSSGMYVRLAFAVAAHLETEILIVDEVLAVGDAAFQQKCLGKMSEVTQDGGRTVIFVSHSMAAIAGLCTRCLHINRGRLAMDGPTDDVIAHYLRDLFEIDQSEYLGPEVKHYGSGKARLTKFWQEDRSGRPLPAVISGQDVVFCFEYRLVDEANAARISVAFSVIDEQNRNLFVLYSDYTNHEFPSPPRAGVVRCIIERFPLIPSRYRVSGLLLVDGEEADRPEKGLGRLTVSEGDFYGTGRSASTLAPFLIRADWSIEETHPDPVLAGF